MAITEQEPADALPPPRPRSLDAPKPIPLTPHLDIPETRGYRFKNRVLGPPLHTEALEHERLGIPTALAVFSSDCISSSAYATEEILRVLITGVGLGAAFALVLPITIALLVVLFFLILSYRETIKEYPTAGGAYMVTRDNFGLLPAQVAGVSLLTDYILTVSVSVAAGTDALTSAVSALAPYHVFIGLFFILIIAFMNLKGVKESGKIFAAPTYFFIGLMGIMLSIGLIKVIGGTLHPAVINTTGQIDIHKDLTDKGLLYGAGLFLVLKAFASGGAAVTGVEAISNGVTAFKRPEWLNARKTLVIMGGTLAVLFFGLSALATKVRPIPYEAGTPTVISQIGKVVFGGGLVGNALFVALQAGTMLILVLAANTSFADFPRLASFHAGDHFMPKQLTKRGHRLVFSNGIIFLAIAAATLLVITGAKVEHLIPLYAVGVFTSFTMSQAGMAKHHIRKQEPGWMTGLFINGTGAVLSLIVDIIIIITKFHPKGQPLGAWTILVMVPIMVFGLTRLNKQYEAEAAELEEGAKSAAEASVFRRHTVLLMVDDLDMSTARGIQYARSLHPDELLAVHVAMDLHKAELLMEEWLRLGLTRFPLEIVDCPDRRIVRSVTEVVLEAQADGQTEVTVLVPRREYRRFWHRFLHDHTAAQIAKGVTLLKHANVTFIPYQLGVHPADEEIDT
ncbi:MAG: APC family permease [Acidimicrobiales bacterium]